MDLHRHTRAITFSVVVPVYGAKASLAALVARVDNALRQLKLGFELILVDDGCPQGAWSEIKRLAQKHTFVRGIKLSRNFGQHEAITAGLHEACGEWIVVMDCDLQDRPEEISRLYAQAMKGYDIVYSRRVNRQDSWYKKLGSRVFYAVLGYLTDTQLDPSVANFGIYHRKVIQAILQMEEALRFFPVMVRWVGFNATGLEVEHSERQEGKTAYSLLKLLRLASNVMISFSDKPLRLMVLLGFCMSFFAALFALKITIQAIVGDVIVQGWASVMVSLWFVGGLLLMMLGVVGVYIGKTFDETKRRPTYIIDNRTDLSMADLSVTELNLVEGVDAHPQ